MVKSSTIIYSFKASSYSLLWIFSYFSDLKKSKMHSSVNWNWCILKLRKYSELYENNMKRCKTCSFQKRQLKIVRPNPDKLVFRVKLQSGESLSWKHGTHAITINWKWVASVKSQQTLQNFKTQSLNSSTMIPSVDRSSSRTRF